MVEAAAALLEGAGGSLPITSLNKALFYLDLHCLLTSGSTVTSRASSHRTSKTW